MTKCGTVLFIHGAGGGGWEWSIWQRVFAARGLRTRAPDLVPMAAGLAATSFDNYVEQVHSWCADCDAPLVLIGASVGGLLALRACTSAQPIALVLINPMPPADVVAARPRVYPDIVTWGSERSLASTRRAMADADDAACLFAFRRWRDESGAVLRAAGSIQVESPSCPVLVFGSEFDSDVPVDDGRNVASRLGAEFRLLRGASHVGPLLGRAASSVAAATLAWLDFIESESSP
jgi:pimeloyl-ACP methyl ester carboxylesterase